MWCIYLRKMSSYSLAVRSLDSHLVYVDMIASATFWSRVACYVVADPWRYGSGLVKDDSDPFQRRSDGRTVTWWQIVPLGWMKDDEDGESFHGRIFVELSPP